MYSYSGLYSFCYADETRRREPSAKRRSSSATPEGKTRLPGSPKTAQKTAENKQERGRKSSVSKIPTPRQKPEQPVTNKKISTESIEHARGHRSLPSTPRERKSSTTQQNGHSNTVKAAPRSTAVKGKTPGRGTPPSPLRQNTFVKEKSELGSPKPNENQAEKERTMKKDIKTDHEYERENELDNKEMEDLSNMDNTSIVRGDSPSVISNGQPSGPCRTFSDNLDAIDSNSFPRENSSLDEKYSQKPAMNGGRKMSSCSLETDSDVTSDLLSDFTDTDYDFRSQRYSGLSETSSDFSFGTSPAWKLFHSVEHERNALESTAEPDVLELGTSPTVKDCLMNLNLQGSVTPTMKRRIFEAASSSSQKDHSPVAMNDSVSQPVDKAMFFDVEQYNDKSPDEEEMTVGSPRKLSLVQSLISSIEKRSGASGDAHRTSKNATVVTRSSLVSAGKHNMKESAVSQATLTNHEVPRSSSRLPRFDELNKVRKLSVQY